MLKMCLHVMEGVSELQVRKRMGREEGSPWYDSKIAQEGPDTVNDGFVEGSPHVALGAPSSEVAKHVELAFKDEAFPLFGTEVLGRILAAIADHTSPRATDTIMAVVELFLAHRNRAIFLLPQDVAELDPATPVNPETEGETPTAARADAHDPKD